MSDEELQKEAIKRIAEFWTETPEQAVWDLKRAGDDYSEIILHFVKRLILTEQQRDSREASPQVRPASR